MSTHKSVTGLRELYTVVVGLALALGVGTVVGSDGSLPGASEVLAGAAVAVTLIPFYHGGLRHLQDTYADDAVVRRLTILWDFALLFVEACILLAAAASLGSLQRVAWLLVGLWLVDIFWVGGSRLLGQRPPMTWALGNAVAVVSVLVFLLAPGLVPAETPLAAGTLFGVCLLRTIADYWLSAPFYFPAHELGQATP